MASSLDDIFRSRDFVALREKLTPLSASELATMIATSEAREQVILFRGLPRKLDDSRLWRSQAGMDGSLHSRLHPRKRAGQRDIEQRLRVDEAGILIDDIRIREFLLSPLYESVADLMDNKFTGLDQTGILTTAQ